MLPEVIIVGRPNVGKSTLFNRLCRRRQAIVLDTPGITRDLLYSLVQGEGKRFQLIDSGGLDLFSQDSLVQKIKENVLGAVEEAYLILYMVDISSEAMDVDKEIIQLLRRQNKAIFLVVNKVDNSSLEAEAYKFLKLGLQMVFFISAEQGSGIDELLQGIFQVIPKPPSDEEEKEEIKIAVIGRPNVGKSALVNAIMGKKRVLVDEKPGTTRDSVDISFSYRERRFKIIDTAGIRRKAKIHQMAEIISVLKARKSLERADIVLLLIDASQGLTTQDIALGGLVHKAGRGLILVVNKWDLIENSQQILTSSMEYLRKRAKFLAYAPVAFVSAKTGENVLNLLSLIEEVEENQIKRIPSGLLNQFLHNRIIQLKSPSSRRGIAKIFYLTQIGIKPPTFVTFVNYPKRFSDNYLNFMKKRLREAFGFQGTPISIKLRARK